MTETALLITSYSRPEHLRRVLDSISKFEGPILIGQDGLDTRAPANTQMRHYQVRQLINAWKEKNPNIVEVRTLSSHLGCFRANRELISWGFDQCNKLLILEDDIVATPDFFQFASEYLKIESKGIGGIAGMNLIPREWRKNCEHSERPQLSMFSSSWGWATWKCRWDEFIDFDIQKNLRVFLKSSNSIPFFDQSHWIRISRRLDSGILDSWAYRWLFTCWINNWQTIVPPYSMVQNIGFDDLATHTRPITQSNYHFNLNEIRHSSTDLPSYLGPISPKRCVHCDEWLRRYHHRSTVIGQLKNATAANFPYISTVWQKLKGKVTRTTGHSSQE